MNTDSSAPDPTVVRAYLLCLQETISAELRRLDPGLPEQRDAWTRPEGGGGESRLYAGGRVFEKAGVNFSDIRGHALPATASKRHPGLAGRPFRAMGVSVVIHPLNPHVPTTHANVRFLATDVDAAGDSLWWFGGGFDLTPYYPRLEDVVAWHTAARSALEPFGSGLYPRFKEACDRYFFLPHRQETRGVGGVFFDDWTEPDFDTAFALTRAVGETFMRAYAPLVERRCGTPYGERERNFQLQRRGRYVEFNLLQDRGTHFGLQSGGRTESILMSLPPLVRWDYQPEYPAGSPEAGLQDYLRPRDWLQSG